MFTELGEGSVFFLVSWLVGRLIVPLIRLPPSGAFLFPAFIVAWPAVSLGVVIAVLLAAFASPSHADAVLVPGEELFPGTPVPEVTLRSRW